MLTGSYTGMCMGPKPFPPDAIRVREVWHRRLKRIGYHALARGMQDRSDHYKAAQVALGVFKGIGEFAPDQQITAQSFSITLAPDLQAALLGKPNALGPGAVAAVPV